MTGPLHVYRRFLRYFDDPDPRVGLAGSVALVVAGNLPFYPAYVWWIAGEKAATAACLAWLSVPAFAAVPALARRRPELGKGMLLVAGLANTVLCALALGSSTGMALFLLPCLVLGALLFSGRRRTVAICATLCTSGALTCLAATGVGLASVAPEEGGRLWRLNALSVLGLMIVIAASAWRRRVVGAR